MPGQSAWGLSEVGGSCGGSQAVGRPGDAQQEVAESLRRALALHLLVLAADHGDLADLPGLGLAVAVDHPLRRGAVALGPLQLGQLAADREAPGRLGRLMAVVLLIDLTGPAAELVRLDPALAGARLGQAEPFPGSRSRRVLHDAAVVADIGQRRRIAAAVLTKLELL